jgi:malate dehydrogenase (oxaloacetate-decarboxylating)(NADP+)
VYDDDIHGTGGVRLAGLINTLKITGGQLKEQKVLSVGAAPAAIGLADLTVAGMGEQSVTPEAARQQIRMFDTQGVGRGRPGLAAHKLPYSRKLSPANPSITSTPRFECPRIVAAIEDFKPTVLIGVYSKALNAVWAGSDPRFAPLPPPRDYPDKGPILLSTTV